MRFKYTAALPTGEVSEGEISATDIKEALEELAAKGLTPITIKPKRRVVLRGRRFFAPLIGINDKIFLTRYISLMLRSGTDLFRTVKILITDYEKPGLRNFLMELRYDLEQGRSMSFTFAKYPQFFDPVFVNLIKAGEASGNLEVVFDRLSTSLETTRDFKGRVRSALIYPVFLLIMSGVVVTFLTTFALPKIASVFEGTGFEPPAFSKMVFTVGGFIAEHIWTILSLGIGGLLLLFILYRNFIVVRRLLFDLFTKIKIVRNLTEKMAIQRFASTLASLIEAGIDFPRAVEITAEVVGNQRLKDALIRISRERLAKGWTISDAFSREPFFPRTVVNLISIAEKTGNIETTLQTLADFYRKEVDKALKDLVTILEPILLLVMGLIIGFIAISIIVPIYQMATQF